MSGRSPALRAENQRHLQWPAIIADHRWRVIALAASLLLAALTASGCGVLNSQGSLSSALLRAGYQRVAVGTDTSNDAPPGGLITIHYTKGPTGHIKQDAMRAEKIVWDSFPYGFGRITITEYSAQCAPACPSHITSAAYSQLAAKFGPRPRGLRARSMASGAVLSAVSGAAAIVAGVVIAVLWWRRSYTKRFWTTVLRRQRAGDG
jgi:hypothetical protein